MLIGVFSRRNLVGYSNQDAKSKAYNTFGSMFISVGSADATWKLGDLKMVVNGKDGGAYRKNLIQFIDPATSKVMLDKVYNYYGAEDGSEVGEDDGWYTYNLNDEDKDDIYSNDVEFPAGTAFLCNFDVRLSTTITFAGQVLTGDVTIDCAVDKQSMPYMYIVNPIAADITLGDIKMVVNGNDGGAYRKNLIQIIDPATSKVDLSQVYNYYGVEDGAEAGEDDGWYTYNLNDEDKDDIYSNDVQLKAAEGFLCNFDARLSNQLIFKNPVK